MTTSELREKSAQDLRDLSDERRKELTCVSSITQDNFSTPQHLKRRVATSPVLRPCCVK